MKYLFLFTVGPVQTFISQARKAQDLYAGSKLLSELISKAIDYLPSSNCKLIFPYKDADSKPNRLIALIEVKDENALKNLGNQLEEKVKNYFSETANNILGKNEKPNNFDNQIKNHLQINWVAQLIERDEDYKVKYKILESSMGAIKNIRTFNQLEETGRKCSLCGERNALFYGGEKKPNYIQNDAASNDELNPKEGLCAVCYTKRFYKGSSSFPSTAEIALSDSINKIKLNEKGKELINSYKKKFKDFDYQLFYEENLNEIRSNKQSLENCRDTLSNIQNTLAEIYKSKRKDIKLSKYYALIMFDGDSMGEWLSGENLKENISLDEFHGKLTTSLGDFAKKANELIELPKGKIVYAGGEDFLGFLNLNYFFDSLKELRILFDEKVNINIDEYKKNESDNLSFSAGIVITHYKYPFSEILNRARIMEKEAKNINDNKNAFAIAVLKHSGEVEKTKFKWGDEDNLYKNLFSIELITNILKEDKYSNTFIKNLEMEFTKLIKENDKIKDRNLFLIEMNRLIKNSCKDKTLINDTSLFKNLENLFNNSNYSINNFLSALNIAEFISRNLNGGKL